MYAPSVEIETLSVWNPASLLLSVAIRATNRKHHCNTPPSFSILLSNPILLSLHIIFSPKYALGVQTLRTLCQFFATWCNLRNQPYASLQATPSFLVRSTDSILPNSVDTQPTYVLYFQCLARASRQMAETRHCLNKHLGDTSRFLPLVLLYFLLHL